MPSISDSVERHVVIDHRAGHYLCFPDVQTLNDGSMLVVYNEYDQHVGNRRRLMQSMSMDGGRTWSLPRMIRAIKSHCPRMSVLDDGQILLFDDIAPRVSWSSDNAATWCPDPGARGLDHALTDRPLALSPDHLVTTGHAHRGTAVHPAIRQAPTEQMFYRSLDRGASWQAVTPIANDRNLTLCEGSTCLLPDGRLACLMRENSMVFEPMYLSLSDDQGDTWSDPQPTPLIGHRPTLGMTPSGKLLVTYRNVGPDRGTAAWMGGIDDLLSDFRVHGRIASSRPPQFEEKGMRILHDGGPDVTRFALRPMTDPRSATAQLTTTVRVDMAEENGFGIRLGFWWRVFPDHILPEEGEAIPVEPGKFNDIRLSYGNGVVALSVNGVPRCQLDVPPDRAESRGIVMGAPIPFEDNAVDCTIQEARLSISEPRYLRDYHWTWHHRLGLPDQWVRNTVLELKNDTFAAPADFGYSGWCIAPDGRFFCAYHHGGGHEPDYVPGHSSRILGTHFSEEDFR